MTTLFEAFEALKHHYLQKIEEITKEQETVKDEDASSNSKEEEE